MYKNKACTLRKINEKVVPKGNKSDVKIMLLICKQQSSVRAKNHV